MPEHTVQNKYDAVIALNASLSAEVDLKNLTPVALILPSSLDGTTISFQAAYGDGSFNNMYNPDDSEYTVTVAVSRHVVLEPKDFFGISRIKVRTGTSASPQVQDPAATIGIVCRDI
jgi:hypothetical protein